MKKLIAIVMVIIPLLAIWLMPIAEGWDNSGWGNSLTPTRDLTRYHLPPERFFTLTPTRDLTPDYYPPERWLTPFPTPTSEWAMTADEQPIIGRIVTSQKTALKRLIEALTTETEMARSSGN